MVQVHSLAVVGLPRSELLQDVPHASGFDLHLGVRLCMLMHAYACLCMLMLQFSLAWSLHGSDINRIMAVGRCVGESTLPVKIGHAKAKTLCLMHLVQSVSKPRHHPVVPVVFALSRGMSLCEGCARQRW